MTTERNFANRTLFHCDNLHVLRGMNSETVDLIATDPPFNKNRDFHATPDSLARGARFTDRWRWDTDVHTEWVDQIKDDWQGVWAVIEAARVASGQDMAAFLCWLGVRVMEMHRILKPTGSLYLHIDHTAHAWVKAMLDGIFDRKHFRNEIVWAYTGPSNTKRWFPRKHDILLFYAKTDDAHFYCDEVRIPYTRISGTGYNSLSRGNRTDAEVKELEKSYKDRGKTPEDWWVDIAGGGHISKNERTGFPTQKPLALYERIIKASSNEDDLVLDPFAGCATTPVAAERLGRQWVGIDIWDKAYQTVLDRLESEGLAVQKIGGGVQAFCKAEQKGSSHSAMSTTRRRRRSAPTKAKWRRQPCASNGSAPSRLGRGSSTAKSSSISCKRRRHRVWSYAAAAGAYSSGSSCSLITSTPERRAVQTTSQTASCCASPATAARAQTTR